MGSPEGPGRTDREGVEDSVTLNGPASLSETGGSNPLGGSPSLEIGAPVVAPGSITMGGSGESPLLLEESDAS